MFINNPEMNFYCALSWSEMKTVIGNSQDVKLRKH